MNKNPQTLLAVPVWIMSLVVCSFADVTIKDVLNELHASNQQEMTMAKMAQEKGATTAMQEYGHTLLTDHQKNEKKVINLASQQQVPLEFEGPGFIERMEMKRLNSLEGSDFNRMFSRHMIRDHKKAIAKMRSAQKSSLPEDVRTLVADLLPTLQRHLELAQKIYGQASDKS